MKRAQAFVTDLALGMILLLIIGVPLGMFLVQNQTSPVHQEAQTVAAGFMNPYPLNWTLETPIIPGFAVEHRINDTMLAETQALCTSDTLENYYATSGTITFTVSTNETTLASCGSVPASADHVGVQRRYAAHNASIATIEVVVWS